MQITHHNDIQIDITNAGSMTPQSWPFLQEIDTQDTVINDIKSHITSLSQKGVEYNTIVLIGIGGSMLGPQALYYVLGEYINPNISVHFINNLDTFELNRISQKLDWDNTLCITITKSGNTPETMAGFYYFKEHAKKNSTISLSDRFLFVCDEGENNLRKEADMIQATCFDIPTQLGGRYSVLSAVGYLFIELLGVHSQDIARGAKQARDEFNKNHHTSNAYDLAKVLYSAYTQNNQHIWTLFPYFNRGEYIGKWFIQLFAESLGKMRDTDSTHISPTPLSAVGSTDQHSILQLFKEGLNDKYYLFLELQNHDTHQIFIPHIENEKLSYLSGHSMQTVLNTQLQATIDSLRESGRPISKLSLTEITPHTIGYTICFFELVCACLGDMFEINTFNQPGVERSKILTKEYLEKKS